MTSRIREKTLKRYRNFDSKYDIIGRIGEGAYGIVRVAKDRSNSQKVAVKSFKLKLARESEGIPLTICREINLLRELHHPNILEVKDVVIDKNDGSFIMIISYCKLDLEKLIKYHRSQLPYGQNKRLPQRLDKTVIISIIYQILLGINYLHSKWIMHRDLKPANILIHDDGNERGVVKIADFGLARIFKDPLRKLADDGPVVTIWYRAPEILLGAKHYTPAIDIWSIGCIFNELVTTRPLFEGKEIKDPNTQNPFQYDQLDTIFKILGNPTEEQWPEMKELEHYPQYLKLTDGKKYHFDLEKYTELRSDSLEFDLLKRMLAFNPSERITAADALNHPLFRQNPPSLHCFEKRKDYSSFYPDQPIFPEPVVQQVQEVKQHQGKMHHHHAFHHPQPKVVPQQRNPNVHTYSTTTTTSTQQPPGTEQKPLIDTGKRKKKTEGTTTRKKTKQ
ncbi:hypothetical protein ABK040_007901 [Willaertia magna]